MGSPNRENRISLDPLPRFPAPSTAVKSPRMLTGVPSSSTQTSSVSNWPAPQVDGAYGICVAATR